MRSAQFLGVLLLLFVLQGALARATPLRLDVAALATAYLALERAVLPGAALAFAAGYLADVFGGTERGLMASSMVLAFFTVRVLVMRFRSSAPGFVTVAAVLMTLASAVFSLLVESLLGVGPPRGGELLRAVPPTLLVAVAGGFPCYKLFARLDRRFTEPESEWVFRS